MTPINYSAGVSGSRRRNLAENLAHMAKTRIVLTFFRRFLREETLGHIFVDGKILKYVVEKQVAKMIDKWMAFASTVMNLRDL
jgi:hypothetical protein